MRNFNPFATVLRMPCFDTEGGGAGAGAGASAAGAGAGAAGGGAGAGAGAGAGGGGSAVRLSPDMRIIGEDGQETTYGEYSKRFVPRSEHEGFVKNYRTELKNNLARLAQSLQRQGGPGGGAQAGAGRQAADPFSNLWSEPIVSGQQLKQLADAGFGTLAAQIRQQQQETAELKKQLGQLSGGFGSMAERNLHSDFDRRVTTAITAVAGAGYEKDPFLREVAEDVWHSHENWTRGKEDQEFQDILNKRLTAMEKFIRARDKQRLDDAKKKPFWQRGGQGNPSGPPKFDPAKTNRDRAAALFGRQPQGT
jgi:hypothetical protein